MEKFVGRFKARGADGRVEEIFEYVALLDDTSFDRPDAPPIEGLGRLQTADGRHVNRLSPDEFEVLDVEPFRVRRI
jgi:hypothetical protein